MGTAAKENYPTSSHQTGEDHLCSVLGGGCCGFGCCVFLRGPKVLHKSGQAISGPVQSTLNPPL